MVLPVVTRGGSAHLRCTGSGRGRIADEVFKFDSFPGSRHHFAVDEWAKTRDHEIAREKAYGRLGQGLFV